MRFDPQLAETCFGCGLSPVVAPPSSVQEMMAKLQAPNSIATRFPIEDFTKFQDGIAEAQRQRQIRRQNRGTPQAEAARKARRVLNKEARIAHVAWLGRSFHHIRQGRHHAPRRLYLYANGHPPAYYGPVRRYANRRSAAPCDDPIP